MKNLMLIVRLVLAVAVLLFIACDKKITDPEEQTAKTSPLLVSPAYGSTLLTNTVELIWETVANAETYEVVVDNSGDFSSRQASVFSAFDVQDTTVTTGALNAGVYYWRVRPEDGEWSNVWIFTINNNDPSAPAPDVPKNGSSIFKTNIAFNWGNVSGADAYELQVDTLPTFSNPIIAKENLQVSDYLSINKLLDPGQYFWRVRSRDRFGIFGA